MMTIPSATLSTVKTIPLGARLRHSRISVQPDTSRKRISSPCNSALYECEQPLGDAIAEALQLGLIKSRDELFITSKLWGNSAHRGLVAPALQKSLKNPGLENLDLYLIHFPGSLRAWSRLRLQFEKEKIVPMDLPKL